MTPEQIIAHGILGFQVDSDDNEKAAHGLVAALTAAGYAIVPVEPTPDMCVAGVKVMSGAYPDHIEPTTAVIIGEPKEVYRAMISAAVKEG